MEQEKVYEHVQQRYAAGAQQRQESLCCPVDYDQSLLTALPREIIDKDYGCGDPSRYVREGDRVLDLGSGGGKICYMAAQLVGDQGHVTGVDMTDDMLALARKYQSAMATAVGGDRVTFHKGYIQDLALDVSAQEAHLRARPVTDTTSLQAFNAWQAEQRAERPLIADQSMDLVISNCVLNLVAEADRKQMIGEIFRVLSPGGRVAIADIIADQQVPQALREDVDLWSGCISGAFQETDFLNAFVDAGFTAVAYDKWDMSPWQVVDGIEFRSVTLTAIKPARTDLYDGGHAVLYKGPYAQVQDDLGNCYFRGERMAVAKGIYDLLLQGGYGADFVGFEPAQPVNKGRYALPAGTRRPVVETRGEQNNSSASGGCC